jgi:hypothetical protein
MSTRSNIIIKSGKTAIYMYRHSDGYPACNGIDLADALATAKTASAFVQNLLDRRYDKQSYETEPKRIYELTTDVHGDIEWCYKIEFSGDFGRTVKVGVEAIGFGPDREGKIDKIAKTLKATASVQDFTDFVKKEESDMIARYEARKAAHALSA